MAIANKNNHSIKIKIIRIKIKICIQTKTKAKLLNITKVNNSSNKIESKYKAEDF